jgi:putative endopeptidase
LRRRWFFFTAPSALGLGLVLGMLPWGAPLDAAPGKAGKGGKGGKPGGAEPAASLGIDPAVIDRSIKPCDDFFRYACGGWLAKTEIPADRPGWSRGFAEMAEKNQTTLRELLEKGEIAAASSGVPDGKKLTDYFSACMNEERIEKTAQAELAEQLKPIDGLKTLEDLAREVARQHLGFGHPLFHISSSQDFKDATRVIGALDQGGLGLPDRDYYLKTDPKSVETQKEYQAHIERMLTLAGLPAPQAKAQAQAAYAVEKQLATASMSRTDRRDPRKLYHRLELDGTVKLAPRFPWQAYLTTLGFGGLREINVMVPGFLEGLNKTLAETPIETLKSYLRWHLVHSVAGRLSKSFVDEHFKFYSQRLTGTSQILPRWKRCISATDGALGESLAMAFVKKTFGEEGKAQALELIVNIEAAMEKDIATLPWMDEPTRAAAQAKLKGITNKIGYPDKARDYSALSVSPDSYLKNAIAASNFESRRDLSKIGKPLDRTEWGMTAPTVNAYYEPLLNEIVFPAGILQPPMFQRGAVRAANYGGIGMVMGHEITHGFDDEGRRFDAQGNMKEWWSDKISAEFDRRAACLVEQYSGYTPIAGETVHLDGKLTLGENIADLGGLKIAYHALKLAGQKGPQRLPPKSEFSEDQIFFLSAAQSWCDKRRPEYARLLATVDPHSPPEFRVNGSLSNLTEFAAAFKCQPTDKMVQKNRCVVW